MYLKTIKFLKNISCCQHTEPFIPIHTHAYINPSKKTKLNRLSNA